MKIKRILLITLITAGSMILFVSAHSVRKHRLYEQPIPVEDWMTQPFTSSIEEPLEVEDWMTKPFTLN
jgi:hypothetical protein